MQGSYCRTSTRQEDLVTANQKVLILMYLDWMLLCLLNHLNGWLE